MLCGLVDRNHRLEESSAFVWYISAIVRRILLPLSSRRVVPKDMNNFFLHANWEQQTKESAVVDGTRCCVILECLLTSIACIT